MKTIRIIDKKQNFWQLASIQAAALGLPVIYVGDVIAYSYGTEVAILSVVLGNLILWLVGLAIIGMTGRHDNALENVGNFLGNRTKIAAALVVSVAFFVWYALQLAAAAEIVGYFTLQHTHGILIIGISLGLLVAVLSMGGIRLIKWVNTAFMPGIFILFIIAHFCFKPTTLFRSHEVISKNGIFVIISTLLPGIVNLPTFFRHSKSRGDSFFALSVMTVLVIIFECISIWIGFKNTIEFIALNFGSVLSILLAVTPLICINLVNIYLASGALESIVKRASSSKDYIMLGLLGTIVFTLFNRVEFLTLIEALMNSFISSLGVILILSFFVNLLFASQKRTYIKAIGIISWIIGCLSSVYSIYLNSHDAVQAMIIGMEFSILSFLVLIFIKESILSINAVLNHG